MTVATAFSLAAVSAPAQADSAVTCTGISTPISVSGVPNGTVFGRYCRNAQPTRKALQILVPGITYTNSYFDFPDFGGRYSFSGESSTPAVTLTPADGVRTLAGTCPYPPRTAGVTHA